MVSKLPFAVEWTKPLLKQYDEVIHQQAETFGLETYPNQIEIISSQQMIETYSSIGLPVTYNHWSFGKKILEVEKKYKKGILNLAYEIVINSDPCISYLLEDNSMTMQGLVIAHACYGHNSFFKNNPYILEWTNASAILDYLVFAKKYIQSCEEKYGIDEVECIIDACHSIMPYGVDRFKKSETLSLQEEITGQAHRISAIDKQMKDFWKPKKKEITSNILQEPEENLLYFIEKNSPTLQTWQREIVRIIRKVSQYFYPQKQTKVMNEGWATFWHYHLINSLFNEGYLDQRFMFEFLHQHTNVINQPAFDDQHFMGLNPYTIGYHVFQDIKRISEFPTPEDEKLFPELANGNWIDNVFFAMKNFKDDGFITQYFSPNLIRTFKLFSVLDDESKKQLEVSAIHDEDGYSHLKELLSLQYDLNYNEPIIQVHHVDFMGNRTLSLQHLYQHHRPLDESECIEVLKHIRALWGFQVVLNSVDSDGKVIRQHHST